MKNPKQQKIISITMIIATTVMIILRFLLNEKGRVNPDSIRYQRFARVLPEIDNTVTPLGYPLGIKFFTFFGLDEFWSSKVLGILAYFFILYFAWKKKFYFKESLVMMALFSYVSIFSFTMSEPMILPFVFVFLYISKNVILGKISGFKSVFWLSLLLILLYNIRYSALFIIAGTAVFGILNYKKNYGKRFLFSGIIGLFFIILYKFTFIDYFNEDYVDQWLSIGLHPTSKLLIELFQGLSTSFNPFIHIANPAGGMVNYAIYGIGLLNIFLIVFLFIKNKLNETEKFFVFISVFSIICSYFIQYFYSVNAIDYRLMSPFILPIWLIYFNKIFQIFGKATYTIAVFSLLTGFAFTWLSKGNYLENRKEISQFLKEEKFENKKITFFLTDEKNLEEMQVAELISTVNPRVYITFKPEDTLKNTTFWRERVLRKIKIDKNKYQ